MFALIKNEGKDRKCRLAGHNGSLNGRFFTFFRRSQQVFYKRCHSEHFTDTARKTCKYQKQIKGRPAVPPAPPASPPGLSFSVNPGGGCCVVEERSPQPMWQYMSSQLAPAWTALQCKPCTTTQGHVLPGNKSSHHDTTILSAAQSSHMDKP